MNYLKLRVCGLTCIKCLGTLLKYLGTPDVGKTAVRRTQPSKAKRFWLQ